MTLIRKFCFSKNILWSQL